MGFDFFVGLMKVSILGTPPKTDGILEQVIKKEGGYMPVPIMSQITLQATR